MKAALNLFDVNSSRRKRYNHVEYIFEEKVAVLLSQNGSPG